MRVTGFWLSSSRDLSNACGDNHLSGYTGRPSIGRSYLGTVVDAIARELGKSASISDCTSNRGQVFGGSVVGSNFPAGRALTFGYTEHDLLLSEQPRGAITPPSHPR